MKIYIGHNGDYPVGIPAEEATITLPDYFKNSEDLIQASKEALTEAFETIFDQVPVYATTEAERQAEIDYSDSFEMQMPEPSRKHKRQTSTSGGYYCLDCKAMWNAKGKQIAKGRK